MVALGEEDLPSSREERLGWHDHVKSKVIENNKDWCNKA